MKKTESIETAWNNYRHQLLAFIKARVARQSDAEDILSLAYLKLLQQESRDDMPKESLPWLYRVIRNSIVDYYRASQKLQQLPAETLTEAPSVDSLQKLAGCVEPMINVLDAPYNQILHMSDILQMKNREIADSLKISLSAVKSQLFRGRAKLREQLNYCCEFQYGADKKLIEYDLKSKKCCSNCH